MEASFDGPMMADEGITEEFVKEMIKAFKDQKKIHRKHAYRVRTQNMIRQCLSNCESPGTTLGKDGRGGGGRGGVSAHQTA